MATCEINRTTVINGINSHIRRQMEFSDLFTYEDDLFTIKDESSNFQEVVNNINISFGEELVMRFGHQPIFAIAEPSDSLVNRYIRSKDMQEQIASAEPDEVLSPKQEKEFRRLQEIGLISTTTNTVGGKTYYKIPGGK